MELGHLSRCSSRKKLLCICLQVFCFLFSYPKATCVCSTRTLGVIPSSAPTPELRGLRAFFHSEAGKTATAAEIQSVAFFSLH